MKRFMMSIFAIWLVSWVVGSANADPVTKELLIESYESDEWIELPGEGLSSKTELMTLSFVLPTKVTTSAMPWFVELFKTPILNGVDVEMILSVDIGNIDPNHPDLMHPIISRTGSAREWYYRSQTLEAFKFVEHVWYPKRQWVSDINEPGFWYERAIFKIEMEFGNEDIKKMMQKGETLWIQPWFSARVADYSHEGCSWVEIEHQPEIIPLLPEDITEEWFRHGYFSPIDPILVVSYTLGDCWWDIDPESGDGDVDGADLALCALGTIVDLGALASNFGNDNCLD